MQQMRQQYDNLRQHYDDLAQQLRQHDDDLAQQKRKRAEDEVAAAIKREVRLRSQLRDLEQQLAACTAKLEAAERRLSGAGSAEHPRQQQQQAAGDGAAQPQGECRGFPLVCVWGGGGPFCGVSHYVAGLSLCAVAAAQPAAEGGGGHAQGSGVGEGLGQVHEGCLASAADGDSPLMADL